MEAPLPRSAAARAASRPGPGRGFTLIEVLVVVVIIAVLTSIAVLSIGVLGRDRSLDAEGERLTDVYAAALEQAQLEGRDYGIWFNEGRYQVLVRSERHRRWEAPADDRLYQTHDLPAGVTATLEVEGRTVVLPVETEVRPPVQGAPDPNDPFATPDSLGTPKTLADAAAQLGALAAGNAGNAGGAASAPGVGASGYGDGNPPRFAPFTPGSTADPTAADPTAVVPQVVLYASGDASPFHLSLLRAGSENLWQVDGRADGTLHVTPPGMERVIEPPTPPGALTRSGRTP